MSLFYGFLGLFITFGLVILIFLILSTSETYVTLASNWAIILGLTLVLKIPVRLLRTFSPPSHKIKWRIEKTPPSWLSLKVNAAKNKVTWKDRARFWYLILRYGTQSAHTIVGTSFLPHLIATAFRVFLNRIIQITHNFERSGQLFVKNPIVSYLHFAGSLSAGCLNWIFESFYNIKFLRATEDAARKFGRHEALRLRTTGLFPGNDVKTLMSMIMYIYVVYGLASWMRYCYPTIEPVVETTDTSSVVRFSQGAHQCPHRGLKYPQFCNAFVTWEAALAETINPQLTAVCSKRSAAGDEGCEVTVLYKKDISKIN